MNIETQFYHMMLLVAAVVNILIAVSLLHNNYWYRNYEVYHRSRRFVAITYVIFAIGFMMHYHFGWRVECPEAASALSVSYFHIAAVLFGWSHISLLRPNYLNSGIAARDFIILVVGLTAYWTSLPLADEYPELAIPGLTFAIFFAHAGYIAFTFYRTYFQVRRDLIRMPADSEAPYWWTPEAKHMVLKQQHSFIISGHLIILFGLGGIVFTALLPTAVWPYTLLLAMGIAVFIYIFYSLASYGNVIESACCATEDAVALRDKKKTIVNK